MNPVMDIILPRNLNEFVINQTISKALATVP